MNLPCELRPVNRDSVNTIIKQKTSLPKLLKPQTPRARALRLAIPSTAFAKCVVACSLCASVEQTPNPYTTIPHTHHNP